MARTGSIPPVTVNHHTGIAGRHRFERMAVYCLSNLRCWMGDVLAFPRPVATDGGKARIEQRRKRRGLSAYLHGDDLSMDHADPEYLTLETLEAGMTLPCA